MECPAGANQHNIDESGIHQQRRVQPGFLGRKWTQLKTSLAQIGRRRSAKVAPAPYFDGVSEVAVYAEKLERLAERIAAVTHWRYFTVKGGGGGRSRGRGRGTDDDADHKKEVLYLH
jgi:hypothetical protein